MKMILKLVFQEEWKLFLLLLVVVFVASLSTLMQALVAANLINSSLSAGQIGAELTESLAPSSESLFGQIGYIISIFLEDGNEAATRYVIEQRSLLLLLALAGISFAVLVFSQLVIFGKNVLASFFTMRMALHIRKEMFNHLIYLPGRYFRKQKSGGMLNRLITDADVIESRMIILIENAIFGPVLSVLGLILLLYLDYRLTIVILLNVIVIVGAIGYISLFIRGLAIKQAESGSNINSHVFKVFAMIEAIKIFSREKWENRRYKSLLKKNIFSRFWVQFIDMLVRPMNEILGLIGVVVVIFYGTILIWQGGLTTGELFSFLFILLYIVPYFQRLSSVSVTYRQFQVSVERVLDILKSQVEEVDFEMGTKRLQGFQGEIECVNVSFDYGSEYAETLWSEQRHALAEKNAQGGATSQSALTSSNTAASEASPPLPVEEAPVLRDISFRVKPGEAIAIVGESGSGKTTLVNLLAHFIIPSQGKVLFDQQPHKDFTVASIRQNISMVTQETFLFDGTILENIRYGRLSASNKEVQAAARLAYLHDFITGLDEGYLTQVGERGVRLSGGQKQRISIARAILKKSRILIFDEATSSLDSQSELEVQRAIDRLMHYQTTFIIAHRFSTIRKVDRIFVLSAGRLAEVGTHSELLAQNGIYTQLYNAQFHAEESSTAETTSSPSPQPT